MIIITENNDNYKQKQNTYKVMQKKKNYDPKIDIFFMQNIYFLFCSEIWLKICCDSP